MSSDETYDKGYKKRLITLIVAVGIVITLIIAGLFWLTSEEGDDSAINSNVSITDEEKLAAETLSKEFVKSTGNFGIKKDQLTGDNIRNIGYIIANKESSAKDYLISRSDSYAFANKEHIFQGSALDYDVREYTQWIPQNEYRNFSTFEVSDIVTKPNNNGEFITINNEPVKALKVQVNFNSKQTIRTVSGNDPKWDGSYIVLEKTFVDNEMTLLLAETDTGWKVYAQNGLQNQFLLSTWKTPNSDAYMSAQRDFTQIDTLNLTIPLKEPAA